MYGRVFTCVHVSAHVESGCAFWSIWEFECVFISEYVCESGCVQVSLGEDIRCLRVQDLCWGGIYRDTCRGNMNARGPQGRGVHKGNLVRICMEIWGISEVTIRGS